MTRHDPQTLVSDAAAATRPWRSVLYIPAGKKRAVEKARGLPCDAIILDLEDAVLPEEKSAARAALGTVLAEGGFGGRAVLVRINALDTPWGAGDAAAVAHWRCDGVILPKVTGPADLDRLATLVPRHALWAMMETPMAVLRAAEICAHPSLMGIVMGTNDLAKDLNTRPAPQRGPLLYALQSCLVAAKAQGRIALDGVFNAFRDTKGLALECAQGRDMGFDGKTLIHPDQIAVANAAFGPGPEEIDTARRQIAAFDAARASGQGVAVLDGKIVENLHIVTARATLAKAKVIAELEMV
jgi:(3S)-malyl-CoA thioesterase